MRFELIHAGHRTPGDINVVVERFLYTPTRHPGNYGFVPRAPCGEGDPLDGNWPMPGR